MAARGNIFTQAPRMTPAPKKPKDAEIIELDGINELAAVRVLEKALKDANDQQTALVTGKMVDEFIKRGMRIGLRPKNFRAKDEEALASCQLQSRGAKSGLTEDEAKLLKQHGIPFSEVHLQEPTYLINPKYAEDQTLLERVAEALQAIPDLPKDFIMKIREVRRQVTDDTINAVFTKDKKLLRTLLPIVTTPIVKTTLEVSFQQAWDIAKDVIPQPVDPNAPREPWSNVLTTKAGDTEGTKKPPRGKSPKIERVK